MQLDVLFNAARHPWAEIRRAALEAEEAGFGAVWVYDHLSGAVFGGARMLEAFTLAGALAGITTTIGIGTLVANAATRHPAVMATSAASLQEISAGRFVFGVGAGAAPGSRWGAELDHVGIPMGATMAGRHGRLVTLLDTCQAMWDPHRDAGWDGFPLPSPPPPIIVGVNSVALAEVAGRRTAGVNVRADHPQLDAIFAATRTNHPGPTPPVLSCWTHWSDAALDPDSDLRRSLSATGASRLVLVR